MNLHDGLLRVPAKALRTGVLAGIALLLFTPFVVTTGTVFPFVVGKAIWSRSIIEIVFALWVVLALTKPEYRPPRSWLLILLAVGLVVSLLSAVFGVSFQLSMWSAYERMLGVVDLMHWFVLAMVLVSVLRTDSEWRALLSLNLGVSLTVACLVIAKYHQLDVPFYDDLPEQEFPRRMAGPLGNSIYLSTYMFLNLIVALGFGMHSCIPATATGPHPHGRRRKPPTKRHASLESPLRGGLFWAGVAALHFWGLLLAGAVSGFVGLWASLGFVAVAYAFLVSGRWRRVIALSAIVLLLSIRLLHPGPPSTAVLDSPFTPWVTIGEQITTLNLHRPSVQSRLAAWQTGITGFAERPVLGWGPGNFTTVFGRFASGYATTMEPHGNAHGKFVEVAATTGILGVAAYVFFWSATFLVVWRAARKAEPREQALTVFVGAALAGGLIQIQSIFETAVSSLQTILLLGFVINLETKTFPDTERPRLSARLSAAWTALLRRKGARLTLAAAAAAVAVTGLGVHQAIYDAADVKYVQTRPSQLEVLAEGIDGFKPLANTYRWQLFRNLMRHWTEIRAEDSDRAMRLLKWAEQEAMEVAQTEPENWQIYQSLARLYYVVASTDSDYAAVARHYLKRAQELAPYRSVFLPVLNPPDFLKVRRLDDGRHMLLWRPSKGAGYHQVREWQENGKGRLLLTSYNPNRTSFIPPGRKGPSSYRYTIKACRHPGLCSAVVEWPLITVPAKECQTNAC